MENPIVLVTGGAGYIGSHACRALAAAGFRPVTVDDLSAGKSGRVQWGPLEVADVRNHARLEAIFSQYKPQAVMHFAGQISVPDSVVSPQESYAVNTVGSYNVLACMVRHGVRAIVFSSTAAVYGVPQEGLVAESAPKNPINPYGRSKLMVEQMLADFSAAYGMAYAALRYFNAAGATPEAGLGYMRPKPFHLVPLVMQGILGQRPPLQVFGADYPTPDGTAVRDYVHVEDLAEAHVLALRHIMGGRGNLTLNLGTSQGYSVRQVLETAGKVTGQKVPHAFGPRRAGDPPSLVADAAQAQRVLGWKPGRSGLENIIATDWAWHKGLLEMETEEKEAPSAPSAA